MAHVSTYAIRRTSAGSALYGVLNKFSWLTMSVYACTLAHNPTRGLSVRSTAESAQFHFIPFRDPFVYSSFVIRGMLLDAHALLAFHLFANHLID